MPSLSEALREKAEELKGVRDNLTLSFQDTLLDVGESLAFFTPIDTGLASSNWNVSSDGSREEERLPIAGRKGMASVVAITEQVKKINLGDTATFYNPIEYIDDLENGLSPQAPAGMIVPTKARVVRFWMSNLKHRELT